ncbi:hypothetical protein [Accumulibacter sp.]|uniref:hypothetical protein n=1 Tax=Accumulibacter sp. TaxID=2053492 RepID=UPI002626A404|nr:hypothetical protein [Accumulibacter sp.]
MIDRQGLARWSLEVDDAGFAQALAALGALLAAGWRAAPAAGRRQAAARAPGLAALAGATGGHEQAQAISALLAAARQADDIIDWQAPPLRAVHGLPAARVLADAWSAFAGQAAGRVRIAVRSQRQRRHALLPMLQALADPAVAAGSVYVADAFAADGRIDWQLPFMIAVLPDDPLAEAIARLPAPPRPHWPYRLGVASRAMPRLEVLVFSGSLRQTAARLLSHRSPSHAALVLLLGGLDASGDALDALLRIVADELSAEGVVGVDGPAASASDAQLAALLRLADQLAHNTPLDVALRQAFGTGVTAFLGDDLRRISALSHTVGTLAARLRALPRHAELALSERSLGQLVDSSERIGTVLPGSARGVAAGARAPSARSVSPQQLARHIGEASARYRFDHESDEASSLTEVAGELRDQELAQAVEQPRSRFVQHSFWSRQHGQLVEERQRLRVGVPVLLRLRIGPPDARWQSAPAAFPAQQLPRQQRRHRLQLVFHEPTQLDQPLLGELLLPHTGPSSVVELAFTPRVCADFAGRVTVLHRGRVLQTVLIESRVTAADQALDERSGGRPGIGQRLEARVRTNWSDLGSRRRFDASFVLNHSNAGRPLLTAIAGRRAWAKDLSGIDEPVARINQLLSNVAHSVADYSGGLTEGDNLPLFIELARLGADLYSSLVIDNLQALQSQGMNVDQETHIQIVSTRADAVVPFEFIYQYQPPDDDAGVTFCPNALKALADGACPQDCAGQQQPRRHVCPMGFWGLRKVIERHVYNPAVDVPNQAEVIVQAEPVGDRLRLQLDQSALLAYSQEVLAAEIDPLLTSLRQQLPGGVEVATSWDEWKQAVIGARPTLLVAFPHNTGERQDIALEIGGVPFKTLRLPREYVHADDSGPYPLLLLLGCDTASTAQHYANHIRYFRQAGAAAIVSTIATVFGPHAVKVGEKLLETLLAIQRQSTRDAEATDRSLAAAPCLGEALREAKRQALRDSLPMALCVVAFGDADWRL